MPTDVSKLSPQQRAVFEAGRAQRFVRSTRLKYLNLAAITKGTGGGAFPVQLPSSGLLHRVYLYASMTVAGSLSAPNAKGACSIISNVRLDLNTGFQIFNISGAGYTWLLRDQIDLYQDPTPQNQGRNAVTATTFNLDMVLPVAINAKDPIGLIALQNQETIATLTVTFESDTTVATGATVTGSVSPLLAILEVPADPDNWPRLDVIHQILEDQASVPAGADYTYNWPRGGTYLTVFHLMFANGFTQAVVRAQQSNYLATFTPGRMITLQNSIAQRDMTLAGGAITGVDKRIFVDFAGSDGLGMFNTGRDVLPTKDLTDMATVITPAGAATLITLRRQLVQAGIQNAAK